jgi:hypothetical protein
MRVKHSKAQRDAGKSASAKVARSKGKQVFTYVQDSQSDINENEDVCSLYCGLYMFYSMYMELKYFLFRSTMMTIDTSLTLMQTI